MSRPLKDGTLVLGVSHCLLAVVESRQSAQSASLRFNVILMMVVVVVVMMMLIMVNFTQFNFKVRVRDKI